MKNKASRLKLNRETVRVLNDAEMGMVPGAFTTIGGLVSNLGLSCSQNNGDSCGACLPIKPIYPIYPIYPVPKL